MRRRVRPTPDCADNAVQRVGFRDQEEAGRASGAVNLEKQGTGGLYLGGMSLLEVPRLLSVHLVRVFSFGICHRDVLWLVHVHHFSIQVLFFVFFVLFVDVDVVGVVVVVSF